MCLTEPARWRKFLNTPLSNPESNQMPSPPSQQHTGSLGGDRLFAHHVTIKSDSNNNTYSNNRYTSSK
jgi:hypothetical protein